MDERVDLFIGRDRLTYALCNLAEPINAKLAQRKKSLESLATEACRGNYVLPAITFPGS
jgi:hypothetical protein